VAREKAMLAVLFADVSDSTRMYEKMGDTGAFGQIRECLQILTEATQQFGGWVIKTIGDGVMCAFPSADAAAQAACEMQIRMAQRPASRGKAKITIRIGFHYGNVLREGQDVYGDTVNIAARIAGLATAGHITMTGATAKQLSPLLHSRVRKLTALPVKGKQHAIDVHEITWQEGGKETHLSGRARSFADMVETVLHIEYRHKKFVFRDTLTLGRDETNDIVIDDQMASRNHARIEKRKDKFVLVDQSSNGTYVTITGRKEIVLRREEFVLYGDGEIAFGDSLGDRPDVATVRFYCESAEKKQFA
jgi:class 3 adenylate cyclase